MILGMGVDLCVIARFTPFLTKPALLARIFGADELTYSFARGERCVATLAAGWAAKESFAKALGLGMFDFDLTQAQVVRGQAIGAMWQFKGEVAEQLQMRGCVKAHLSISYEENMVIAYTLLEGK
jgi:holo-[acyl-carrier protein] synthase